MAKAMLIIEDIPGTEDVNIYTENAMRENPTQAQALVRQLFLKITSQVKDKDDE